MAANFQRQNEVPPPRHVAHHQLEKSLKERQLEATQQWQTISLKTSQNYVTYFKKWKAYWKNSDSNEEEADGLGFFYHDPNGEPIDHHDRKWWEYGVVIGERTCEEYMHHIQTQGDNAVKQTLASLVFFSKIQSSLMGTPEPFNVRAVKGVMITKKISARNVATKAKREYADRQLGSMADGYTTDNWTKIVFTFLWKLHTESSSDVQSHYYVLMNRTMTLLMYSAMNRGNTTRDVTFCDMFTLPLSAVGPSCCDLFLFVSLEGKTNPNGRKEHWGVVRHRDWKACPVGGLAFWFFYLWHLCRPRSEESCTPINVSLDRPLWYDMKIFPNTIHNPEQKLSYSRHLSMTNALHQAANITISKKTHAPRGSGARNADLNGASHAHIERMGRWNTTHMVSAYLTDLPLEGLLSQAGFSGDRGAFVLPRSFTPPPLSLRLKIFPWADDLLAKIETENANNETESDSASVGFLQAVITMREVVLQDFAMLQSYTNGSHIFKDHWIFADPDFITYSTVVLSNNNANEHPLCSIVEDHVTHTTPFGHQQRNSFTMPAPDIARLTSSEATASLAFISASLATLLGRSFVANSAEAPAYPVVTAENEANEDITKRTRQKTEYKHLARGLDSIKQIFAEYSVGMCGKASTKELEENYRKDNKRWWGTQNERKTYFKRKRICQLIEESLEKKNELTTVLEFWEKCCELHFSGSVTRLSYALAENPKKEKHPIIVSWKVEFDRICNF